MRIKIIWACVMTAGLAAAVSAAGFQERVAGEAAEAGSVAPIGAELLRPNLDFNQELQTAAQEQLSAPQTASEKIPIPSVAPAPIAAQENKAAPVLEARRAEPALSNIEKLAGSIEAGEKEGAPEGAVKEKSDAAFDNGSFAENGAPAVEDAVAGGPAGADGSGNGGIHSRVVFIQDVFNGPADEQMVSYIQKYVDAGVHVVFMTGRPQKGPNSADEILLNRLKVSRSNPILVVSYNGAKIALHGRAAEPASVIDDIAAFSAKDIETFRFIGAKAQESLGLNRPLAEEALPSAEGAFSYSIRFAQDVPESDLPALRDQAAKAYNGLLAEARLPYRMDDDAADPRALTIHSLPMHFSLPRILRALDAQFHEEKLLENPGKFMALVDPVRSPRLSVSFPRESEVQIVRSAEDVKNVMGAGLGEKTLPHVIVKFNQVEQFVDYWEPFHRRTADRDSFGGSGARLLGGGDTQRHMAAFEGSVIKNLMISFYASVWKGQHKLTSRSALLTALTDRWLNPFKYRIFISKAIAQMMKTPEWNKAKWDFLNSHVNAWVNNFYDREFGNYRVAADDIQKNLVSLGGPRTKAILKLASPTTGKLYVIHTNLERVMKLDNNTTGGRILTAYASMTGSDAKTEGKNLRAVKDAMAMLVVHGVRGEDGLWHYGSPRGPIISKLNVQYEFRTGPQFWSFDATDFRWAPVQTSEGKIWTIVPSGKLPNLLSPIERLQADQEYLDYYKEHDEEADAQDVQKPSAKRPAKKAKNTAKRRVK